MKLINILPFAATLFSVVLADTYTPVTCDASNHCPEDLPCCGTYGTCGNGTYCLGGCDVRFSYNLSACMPAPIISEFNKSFPSADGILKYDDYLGNYSEGDWVYSGYIDEYDDSLIIQMPNQTTGTVISTSQYMWFGKVSAKVKSSRTDGVVTAFILFSDVQDEIDYELVGYDLDNAQSNYYSQGALNYTNSVKIPTTDTFANWHVYEIDWTEDRIIWSIDDKSYRSLNKNDTWNATANRFFYPQTPSRLQMSLWPGGAASNAVGTIEWAGGLVDWNSPDIQEYGYFYADIAWVSIQPYDTPAGVKMVNCNSTLCNAYVYNSSFGVQENITMVNAKTWLGYSWSTGLDPNNEDVEEVHTVTSGSKTLLSTSTKTATADASAQPTWASWVNTYPQYSTPADYKTEYGFVQDNSATSTAADGSVSGSSTKNGVEPNYHVQGTVGIFASILIGIFSFFL